MDGAAVLRAVAECQDVLCPAVDLDWTRPAANVDWTVARTAAHIAEGLLWYATDMAAGPTELSTLDLTVRSETPPTDLLVSVRSFGIVLARVLDAADPADGAGTRWACRTPVGSPAVRATRSLCILRMQPPGSGSNMYPRAG